MTRTKQKLVEFMQKEASSIHTSFFPDKFAYILADKLIESGWVEVDKPRNFWLYKHEGDEFYRTTSIHPDCWHQDKSVIVELIHVKEVLEGSEG